MALLFDGSSGRKPMKPRPLGYPLDARCQTCGEEYGDHSMHGKLCPGRAGAGFKPPPTCLRPPRSGRPPIDPVKRRDQILRVRTTKAERELLQRVASAGGLDVSTWARARLLEVAGLLEATQAEAHLETSSCNTPEIRIPSQP